MITFLGRPEIKAQCVARLEAEWAIDHRNQKIWRDSEELGIPKWLCEFAGYVPAWHSSRWSIDFLQAVPVGVDLDPIKGPFLVFVLGCARGVVTSDRPDALRAIDRTIALWKRPDIGSDNWLREAREVEEAAHDAESASKDRPSWNAAGAAGRAAQAAQLEDAVVFTMSKAVGAAVRAREASRTDFPMYDYSNFSDELMRLIKTARMVASPKPA